MRAAGCQHRLGVSAWLAEGPRGGSGTSRRPLEAGKGLERLRACGGWGGTQRATGGRRFECPYAHLMRFAEGELRALLHRQRGEGRTRVVGGTDRQEATPEDLLPLELRKLRDLDVRRPDDDPRDPYPSRVRGRSPREISPM